MTERVLPTLLSIAFGSLSLTQDLLHHAINCIPAVNLPPGYADRIRAAGHHTENAWAALAPIVRHPSFPAAPNQEDPPMTANPISARLRSCQNLHNALQHVLEETLTLAKSHRYKQDWIDAIKKALTDNQESWSHLNNVATVIELVAPPLPL